MNNVSKSILGGKSAIPSAFKIREILLTNHEGIEIGIQNIVVKTIITESLYSNTLICKLSVRDENNVLQDFTLIGQEKVRIRLTKRVGNDDTEIDLTFYITEYPLFGRGANERVQAWSFSGISEHAYFSQFKKISRSVNGITTDAIGTIFESDLKSDKLIVGDKPITTFKGVINTQSPLSAVEWLRRKTYDDKQSPYYLYETLQGKVNLRSQSELVAQEPYHSYIDGRGYNHDAYSEEDYAQRRSRVLSIASDLKMGKVFQAMDGAYASENFYLDIANKTFTSTKFSYDIADNSLGKKSPISTKFAIDDETINNKHQSHHEYVSTNAFAFGDMQKNYNEIKKNSGGRTKAFVENMESMSHDIRLFGDFELNAGIVINLKIPKSVDPVVQRDVLRKDEYGSYDEHLSGNYIITSAIHIFEDGEYFTDLRIKRDSFTIDIDK